MNIELFEKIKKSIRAEPRRLDMIEFSRKGECGTVACIAGWALIESGIDPEPLGALDISRTAERLLGVDGNALFYPTQWPEELEDELHAADLGTPEYVEICCKAIDEYINDPSFFNEEY